MIDKDKLSDCLLYDPETGIFIWKKNGERAGGIGVNGYRRIQVNHEREYEHTLAWLISGREIPEGYEVDHVNPNENWNNSLSNLRLSTKSQNQHNQRKPKNNTSGVKGVSMCKQTGKWRAAVTVNRKYHLVGRFDSIEEAAEKVRLKREELHGVFSRHE